jgi:outer membrane protein assembly factor BamB
MLVLWACQIVYGGDWPMWRYDAGHTAASPDDLPNDLALSWTRVYAPRTQVWDDPLNHDMMPYDRLFEPVVKDGRMFVNFNDSDKVVALDVESGEELWTFYTDGPVRFPAVAWNDAVLFGSDDGYLYCVNASDGGLRWKFCGAPGARKAIGNGRMISAWPARGGPVVSEDRVYFAASIWPFMGTYIWCLNAAGEVVWVNDSTAADYIRQPHSAPSFAGVAPQGDLAVVGDDLIVPGGRSVPAVFERKTGKLRHFLLNEGGKGNGGSLVLGRGKEFYVHTRVRGVRAFELASGNKTAFMTNEPVLEERLIFAAEIKELKPAEGSKDQPATEVPVVRAYRVDNKELVWEVENIDGSGDIIKAGDRLYVAGRQQLTALQLKGESDVPAVAWTAPLDESHNVQRLLAGSGRLFAVTLEGSILCFGSSRESRVIQQPVAARPDAGALALAQELVEKADASQGYAICFGADQADLLDALLQTTRLQIVVVDRDARRVEEMRRKYDAAGLYGTRISWHVGTIDAFQAPPYVARLVILGKQFTDTAAPDSLALRQAYESVRPYGGCLVVLSGQDQTAKWTEALRQARLEKPLVGSAEGYAFARRVGALSGAADWTHQYGNIANTVKSDDSRVKLPLGVLWFGGSSNLDVLPRHGHGPPEQVVNGRLFIEGMNSLSCRDVYTGQVLWKRTFDDLGTFEVYFDNTYKDTPLDTAYNQVHIPGANGRGTNFVATADGVYIVVGDKCEILDVDTGDTLREIRLPAELPQENRQWGFIGIYEDVLLGGAGFANYAQRHSLAPSTDEKKDSGDDEEDAKAFGPRTFDTAASAALVAFNRHTGEVLWKFDARHSLIHNGIVAGDGKVFCLDKLPRPVEEKLQRRGIDLPETYRIVALDYETGDVVWEQTGKIFGTWLGYSERYQLLLHAGAAASDRLKSEVGQGMAVYRGQDGSVAWRVEDRAYSGPCILLNDTILTNFNSYSLSAGAFSLLNGSPKMINNPLTQEPQEWQLCRTYGCNTVVAAENLLTFRSGAAGYYDLQSMSGTGNLGGFKSGCTSNLIVANGVLNAPDYTRTCSCGYQNQTSLALVHMPEMEMWTVNDVARLSKPGQPIRRIGVNFGAPGDRVDPDGTLWIEYPTIGGDSVDLPIQVTGDVEYFRRNSLAFAGSDLPWISSSGVENVEKVTIPLRVKGAADDLQFRVQDANNDAEEQADGSVNLSSSDLELVSDKGAQTVGIRFENVTIQRGKKVKSAYIQFACDEASSDPTKVLIRAEDADSAAPFTETSKNLSSRALLGEGIAWVIPAWATVDQAGERERSPDLTKLVQALVDRPNWQSGNAISFLITGEGHRVAKSQAGTAQAPTLMVTVEGDEPPPPPPAAYTVQLVFSEPENLGPQERRFDIQLGDQVVEVDFDVLSQAGGPRKTLVREYRDVMLRDSLTIRFQAKAGKPIISGVEIVRQDDQQVAAE